MGLELPKQFRVLGGRLMFEWSLDALLSAGCRPVVFVVPEEQLERVRRLVHDERVTVTAGGDTRQASVSRGLQVVAAAQVVVHDAARPLCTSELVRRVLAGLERAEGSIAAIPVDETLKRAGPAAPAQSSATHHEIAGTADRSGLWRAQTPQAFRTDVFRDAHRRAELEGFVATDDAELVERYGGRVVIVEGIPANIKVTRPGDFELAERLLEGAG